MKILVKKVTVYMKHIYVLSNSLSLEQRCGMSANETTLQPSHNL